MGRHVEGPWFRAEKNTWYVTEGGKMVSLGVRGAKSRAAAWAAYLARSGGVHPPAPPVATATPPPYGPTIGQLVDHFLTAAAARLKPGTIRIYALDLRGFARWNKMGERGPNEVRPSDVQAWAAQLKVADTTKAMSIRSVGAFFGWLVKDGVLDANPVGRVVKPKSRKRGADEVVTAAEHAKLLAAASPLFAAVLRFLWATGCRPGEVSQVTAAAFDEATRTVRVASHKTDRTGHARILFLDEETAALVADLCRRHPQGAAFRTYKGTVWTGRAITEAMKNTARKAGVRRIAYGYRHAFGTEALAAGIPDAQVAAMMGHSTTATLHAHYSHVTAKARQLSEAAEELRKKRAG